MQRVDLRVPVRRGAARRDGQRLLAVAGGLEVHLWVIPLVPYSLLSCWSPDGGAACQSATRAARTGTSAAAGSGALRDRRSSASRAATARVDSSSARNCATSACSSAATR